VRVFLRVTAGEEALGDVWALSPAAVLEGDGCFDVGFSTREEAERAASTLTWPCEVVEVDDRDALDAWKAHAEPVRIGDIVLVPSWLHAVSLDPGNAFGSGSHPSTRLCISALQSLVRTGSTVLDVGCGSGVLAVVARLLGASTVVAIDVAPEAVQATLDNAARNGAAVDARHVLIEDVEEVFDIVVANIGALTLTEMAAELRRVAGEHLVLAGLLVDQVPGVVAAIGLDVVEVLEEDGWAAPILRSRGAA
jgi:ribosomal protein L11 methyltransferase